MRRAVDAVPFDPELIGRYRAVPLEHVPWIVEELDGAAEGADLDPLAVFAASIEELVPDEAPTGCTDLVVTGARTADGHLLVAHTNDLYAEEERGIVAIEWRVPGQPVAFTLGAGPWVSVGWNDAGLSVTGNEVSPNDEGVGIPRILQVREVLTRRTLDEAVDATLHPARSSAYNWVLAHPDGGAANVEASATSAVVHEPGEDGFLTHTNHYTHDDMVGFERPGDYTSSCARLDRARELGVGDRFTVERLRELLADHENGENAICRHGDEPKAIKTVFWCIADVTAGKITYGRGNPCDSEPQVYRF
jgi:isopenicillin-N N-acyltransferase like protein